MLAELQENNARKELTGAERKAFAAEVGRICLKLEEKSKEDGESNLDTNWILDFADKSGLSKATAHNWWAAFTKAAGLSITPKQATDENRQAFFAWLDEQKAKEEAAEVGRILEKLSENGNSDHYGNFPNGKGVLWIDELSKNAGMERRTVQNWWSAFTKSAGLSITPKQATDENRQAFFAWLGERRGRPKTAGEILVAIATNIQGNALMLSLLTRPGSVVRTVIAALKRRVRIFVTTVTNIQGALTT